LARAIAGQNHFLLGPADAFCSFFNGNEECEQRFYSNSYDSYLGSGYWQQFEEMASARQSSSIASGASNKRKPSKNCSSNYGPKIASCWRAESQEHATWTKICEEINFRMKSIIQVL